MIWPVLVTARTGVAVRRAIVAPAVRSSRTASRRWCGQAAIATAGQPPGPAGLACPPTRWPVPGWSVLDEPMGRMVPRPVRSRRRPRQRRAVRSSAEATSRTVWRLTTVTPAAWLVSTPTRNPVEAEAQVDVPSAAGTSCVEARGPGTGLSHEANESRCRRCAGKQRHRPWPGCRAPYQRGCRSPDGRDRHPARGRPRRADRRRNHRHGSARKPTHRRRVRVAPVACPSGTAGRYRIRPESGPNGRPQRARARSRTAPSPGRRLPHAATAVGLWCAAHHRGCGYKPAL